MRKSFCFVIAMFAWAQAVEVAEAQTNKAVNYSFEISKPGDPTKAQNWELVGAGYARRYFPSGSWDQNYVLEVIKPSSDGVLSGALQQITFNQTVANPIAITARVWGYNIADITGDKWGASVYVRFQYTDGTFGYCSATPKTKNVGTFGWRLVGCNSAMPPNPLKPVKRVDIQTVLAAKGKALFDDVHAAEYLPDGSRVAFRIDDGTLDTYAKAYPSLKSRGWCGSIALVPTYLTSGDPTYMNTEQAKVMVNDCFELLSHSWSHKDLTTLPMNQMEGELYSSKRWFTDNLFPTPKIFALPLGGYNQLVLGTNSERGYYEYVTNSDTGDVPMGAFRYAIQVVKIESNTTLADINTALTKAFQEKKLLVLLVHKILPSCADRYCVTEERWEQILTAVQGSGIPVMTLGEALDSLNSPR